LHALDPGSVPSDAALIAAQASVDALLERHLLDHGRNPKSIGLVLWGLDNIKTQGEGIAQALLLLGVRPRKNSIGRVPELEVLSLDVLKRPRVDVTITTSGIFRDIFGLQLKLLDRAVRLVADLDESEEQNPIRARVAALKATGFDDHTAKSRVFSNAPGAYGTYIDHMVNLSKWEHRSDLALSYSRRKSFRFDGTDDVDHRPDLLLELAKHLDATVQNLDSAEVSLTDVDHYFEYLGGLTALAEHASGKRPPALLLDATSGSLRVRSLEESVRLETRTKLLNPKWREGLLAHGYEGVEEIRKRLEYTFGWSATAEAVPGWIYQEFQRAYLEDKATRDRLQSMNPLAYQGVLERLTESATRGFWSPTESEWRLLQDLREQHEDALEGVQP
jgi:magnesium chelatase subunit H